MSLRLNRTLFQQSGADSAALTMLASVVHRPSQVGEYVGTVYRDEQAVGEFSLRVIEDETPLQVQIDLATQRLRGEPRRAAPNKPEDQCCDEEADGRAPTHIVGRGGYVVFHVSGGGGYSVQLAAAAGLGDGGGGTRAEKPWTSRELQAGDLFAVSLLRPGAYRVANQAGVEGVIKLAYPERGKTAYRPPDPARIKVTQGGFEPSRIALQPIQGQVYEVQAPSRITIALVEPEDRPEPPDGAPRARYSLVRRHPTRVATPARRDKPGKRKSRQGGR